MTKAKSGRDLRCDDLVGEVQSIFVPATVASDQPAEAGHYGPPICNLQF
jgi:hypothetical protein